MSTAAPPAAGSAPGSDAIALLAELRAAGVTLTAAIDYDGPPDVLTEATLHRIRQHKPALLRLMVNPYRRRCENPQRQRVCDLLAAVYDTDPLRCMDLARTWYGAMDHARRTRHRDPDAAAWSALVAADATATTRGT